MKLGTVSKPDKRNKMMSKRFYDDFMSGNCGIIVIFLIYVQFRAIRKLDSESIVFKTYIFINSNFLSYKIWKQNYKISNTVLTLLLWVKVIFFPKNAVFFTKNADLSKIKRALVLKGIFSETTYVCVLTDQISSF